MASSVPPLFPVELAGVVSRYRASERAKRARVPGVFPLELPAGTAFTDLPYTAACERSNPCHRRASPCNPCSPSFSRFSRSCHFSPPPPPPLPPHHPAVLLPFAAGSSESSFVSALSDAERTGNSSSSSFPTSSPRCYIWRENVLIIRTTVVFCLRTKIGNRQAYFEGRFQLMVVLLV